MFNPQEQNIIQWGLQNGKTKDDVTKAITNYRAGITAPKQETQTQQLGYGERVNNAVGEDINKRVDRTSDILARKDTGIIEKGTQLLGQGAGLAANTLETAVGEIPGVKSVTNAIGQGIDWLSKTAPFKAIGDKIGGTQAVQEAIKLYDTDPNFKDTVDGVANLARLGMDVDAAVNSATFAKNVVSKIGKATKNALESIATGITEAGGDVAKNTTPKVNNLLDSAIKDATPSYEASSKSERLKLGNRVKEGGLLKERTIVPDEFNKQAGEALSKVPGYDPNATKLAKLQTASQEASRQGEALKNAIKAEKVVVPKKQISSLVRKSIEKTAGESLLLQASDPSIKQYMRVLNNALKKEQGTLEGVFKLRKLLDDAYENARGKQAFGSDKISALDDVQKAGRDALNKYLIDNAQNVDVKTSLKSQWDLYRAIDELRTAAERESGSVVGRLIQNNPIASKAVELGAKAVGLGKVVNLAK